jgi:hypothetical protein
MTNSVFFRDAQILQKAMRKSIAASVPCHNSHTGSELVFSCSSGRSSVFADQALDDVGALNPGGHIDRLAGLVQRRSLFP